MFVLLSPFYLWRFLCVLYSRRNRSGLVPSFHSGCMLGPSWRNDFTISDSLLMILTSLPPWCLSFPQVWIWVLKEESEICQNCSYKPPPTFWSFSKEVARPDPFLSLQMISSVFCEREDGSDGRNHLFCDSVTSFSFLRQERISFYFWVTTPFFWLFSTIGTSKTPRLLVRSKSRTRQRIPTSTLF